MLRDRLLRHTKAASVIGAVCALNLWFVTQVTGQTYSTSPRMLQDYSEMTGSSTTGSSMGGSSSDDGGSMSGGSSSGN